MAKTNSGKNNPVIEELRSIYEAMSAAGVAELELRAGVGIVKVRRATVRAPQPQQAAVAEHGAGAPAAAAAPAAPPVGDPVVSPINGVFYRSPSPSSPPFVNAGDVVSAGATLCIVEAMKVMNEIKAERRCKVLSILPENGDPVTSGTTLFLVETL